MCKDTYPWYLVHTSCVKKYVYYRSRAYHTRYVTMHANVQVWWEYYRSNRWRWSYYATPNEKLTNVVL